MLSDRLEQLIKTLGIKKGDFAEKIGFTQAYISMVLNNTRQTPSDRFFESINRNFNVNVNWLKTGTGDIFEIDDGSLSPSEYSLVKKYNLLPLSEKRIIDKLIDSMVIEHSSLSDDFTE